MKITIPAITDETRNFLTKRLNDHFQHENGDDLQAVVSEVLNDRDIFTFLSVHLNREKGLRLGRFHYFDEKAYGVDVDYGLTLDFDRLPRKTVLYVEEEAALISSHNGLPFHRRFPIPQRYEGHVPTARIFVQNLNEAIQNFKKHITTIPQLHVSQT